MVKPKPPPPHKWRGIFKLLEEMGELTQVLGKLGPFPEGRHPDGGPDLRVRAEEEISDLLAAIRYFSEANHLDGEAIRLRAAEKYDRFKFWVLTGIQPDQP